MNAPKRGEIGWIGLDPQRGHEQAGRRPVLVLSGSEYNALTGLIIACPITKQVKGYPTELPLADGMTTQGVILVGQVRTLDWRERGFARIELAPTKVVGDVRELLLAILEE